MLSSEVKESFFSLIRLGIGHDAFFSVTNVNWDAFKVLADKQGLSAIVLDGIDKLNTNLSNSTNTIPLEFKLEWIGEVLQDYEHRYTQYQKAIGSLAGFYNQHGFKMMVLKGYACSLDWPRPEHRPCGDIDIWLFGQQKEADQVLSTTDFTDYTDKGSPDCSKSVRNLSHNYIEIDNRHHHHSVFNWGDFMVENHYDFINVHHHKSNAEFEKILKELGNESNVNENDNHNSGANTKGTNITNVVVNGEKVYLPSPNLHALFLLKHLMMHFASEGITLRQLLDWGFFVQAHKDEVDWGYVLEVLERFGMKNMFNIINAICVGDLGFDVTLFPTVQFDPKLKDRVLNEILFPEFPNTTPDGLMKRIPFKIRRWKGNAWKHELCYKDSLWSAFWSGVWNHLLKPSSI